MWSLKAAACHIPCPLAPQKYGPPTTTSRYPNEELNRNQWYAGRMDGLVWGYETVGIAKTDAEMEAHLASLPNGGQSQLGSKWAAGDIMYKDLNGDGKISSGDGTLNDLGDLKVVANTQLRFK